MVIHVLARCFLIVIAFCWLGAQAQNTSPVWSSACRENCIEDHKLVLPDVQTLQDRFNFFIARDRDLFEYEAAEKLAQELGKSSISFVCFMGALEKVVETIVNKNVESYTKDKIYVDVVGLKIQYMMLFLAAFFQDDVPCGRYAFEFYIQSLGLCEEK